MKIKNIYIVCPRISQGGVESLFQLCDKLIFWGYNAKLYFVGKGEPPLHLNQYKVEVCDRIIDDENNLIIVPEILTSVLNKFSKIKKIIWWLSLDYYFMHKLNKKIERFVAKNKILDNSISKLSLYQVCKILNKKEFDFSDKHIYHLYNCEYVKQFLLENKISQDKMHYLCGPLNNVFIDNCVEYLSHNDFSNKKNIIVYNPAKGYEFTKEIISYINNVRKDLVFVPLFKMSPQQIMITMKNAKLYIDFGYFPGPERIPREAVVLGCNIITSTSGSANNDIDILIPKKYKFEKTENNIINICNMIFELIDNYSHHFDEFNLYREKVIMQKKVFSDSIRNLFYFEYE